MDKGKENMAKENEGEHHVRKSISRISIGDGEGLRLPPSSEHKIKQFTLNHTLKENQERKGTNASTSSAQVKEINASSSSAQVSGEEDLLTSLRKEFETLLRDVPSVSLHSSIYRVPERIRGVRSEAYTPMIVSIGPFHHVKEETEKVMDDYKLGKLKDLVKRKPKILVDLLKVVEESEKQTRNCYAENIPLENKELIKIMLLDGIFIVKLFCEYEEYEKYEKERGPYHQIFSNHWISNAVYRDLLLLENQLPFFLLQKMFTIINDQADKKSNLTFLQLTKNFLVSYATIHDYFPEGPKGGEHLVDLLLKNICSPFNVERRSHSYQVPVFIPSATELHDKGIILRKGSMKKCILEVEFANGVLSIPHLHIDGRTESLFRNLLAMEQSHCGKTRISSHNVFSDYLILLDCLINTPADVALLRERRIIQNELGDDKELAQLFNNLRNGVDRSSNKFFYNDLFEKVNRHMKNRWPTWSAIFQKDYLSTPWKIASITAALILVLCTMIQTACSIKQTHW